MSAEPEKLGKYPLLELLGQGGMGAVYKSHHPELDLPIAIKVMELGNAKVNMEEFTNRFIKEGRLAASINHSNVVRIYDAGNEGDKYYLVMEFIDGQDVRALAKEHEYVIPIDKVLNIIIDTAKALKAAHAAGIIHRDIKPENILLTKDGDVKLADLGIAKQEGVKT